MCDDADNTILHHAILSKKINLVELVLTKFPKDLDKVNIDYNSPLHIATENESLDIVRLLLTHRANVNLKNKDGSTSLHVADKNGQKKIAKLLITNGADTQIKNSNQQIPSDIAPKERRTSLIYVTEKGKRKFDLRMKEARLKNMQKAARISLPLLSTTVVIFTILFAAKVIPVNKPLSSNSAIVITWVLFAIINFIILEIAAVVTKPKPYLDSPQECSFVDISL